MAIPGETANGWESSGLPSASGCAAEDAASSNFRSTNESMESTTGFGSGEEMENRTESPSRIWSRARSTRLRASTGPRLALRFSTSTSAENPDKVADAKTNPKAIGWFVGQVMKASGGKANPQAVNELLKKRIGV